MIELFTRKTDGFTPIHVSDSVSSLSAILLNDDYYKQLKKGRIVVDGYSIINIETIILFKIKACLDLNEKRIAGEKVDSRNVKKHKNDIFRLLINVFPSRKIEITKEVSIDVYSFVDKIRDDKPDLKNLGIRVTNLEELLNLLMDTYISKEES